MSATELLAEDTSSAPATMKPSPTDAVDHSSGGMNVESVSSPVVDGDLRIPRLGCDGRGAAGEDSRWNGTALRCGAIDFIHATVCCGGDALKVVLC